MSAISDAVLKQDLGCLSSCMLWACPPLKWQRVERFGLGPCMLPSGCSTPFLRHSSARARLSCTPGSVLTSLMQWDCLLYNLINALCKSMNACVCVQYIHPRWPTHPVIAVLSLQTKMLCVTVTPRSDCDQFDLYYSISVVNRTRLCPFVNCIEYFVVGVVVVLNPFFCCFCF